MSRRRAGLQTVKLRSVVAVGGALVVAVAGGVTGCGSDESKSASSDSGGTKKITVAYIQVAPAAPLVLGVKKGFFKAEGLDVKLRVVPGGSLLPSVVSNQAQFAFNNAPAALLGKSNGLPLKVVAPAATLAESPDDAYARTLVKKGSPIKTAKDLNGKKIAVDALFQIPHLLLLNTAAKLGADPASFKIVEMPFPTMVSALNSGKVDAMSTVEPFVHAGLAAGDVPLFSNNVGWPKDAPTSVYVTSDREVSQDKDTVAKFKRAIEKSTTYASTHEAEIRQIIPTFTMTPVKAAAVIWLPKFSNVLGASQLEAIKASLQQAKALKKDVDVNDLLIPAG